MLRLVRGLLPLLASFLALAVPASAKEPAAEIARPALWKVSDRDTTIWLFGTVHALPPGVRWFDGKVAQAFNRSDELVTEIVEADPAQMQAAVVSRAFLPQGQSLRAMMTPQEQASFEEAMRSLKLPIAAFDRFEPWYAAIALATGPALREGYASANGVEGVLDSRARVLRRTHTALETPEYQLSLFDGLTAEEQKRYLAEVIRNLPTMKSDLDRMVEAWKRGDADTLARLMNEGEDDPALTEKLLVNRNRNWAGWVRERMSRPGRVFVAVGAGHLAGPGSLQEQLAGAGIVATRVQ